MKRKQRQNSKPPAPCLEVEAFGQTWRFQRFDLENIHDPFMKWARSELPDPMDEVALQNRKLSLLQREEQEKENPNQAQIAWFKEQMELNIARALDLKCSYLGWNDPSVVALRSSPRGIAQLFYLLLRKNHQEVTPQIGLNIFFVTPTEIMIKVMNSVIPSGTVEVPANMEPVADDDDPAENWKKQ